MQCRGSFENGAFLVAICSEIVISRHFRVAIGSVRLEIWAILHKFSTVIFANLLKIMDFRKVESKKACLPCKDSPHRPTLRGNCHMNSSRNMYGFFMWQLPTKIEQHIAHTTSIIAVLCAMVALQEEEQDKKAATLTSSSLIN